MFCVSEKDIEKVREGRHHAVGQCVDATSTHRNVDCLMFRMKSTMLLISGVVVVLVAWVNPR